MSKVLPVEMSMGIDLSHSQQLNEARSSFTLCCFVGIFQIYMCNVTTLYLCNVGML